MHANYCSIDRQLLIALQQSRRRSDSQKFVENRDFAYPPAFDVLVSGVHSRSEYCRKVWYEKNYNGVATRR